MTEAEWLVCNDPKLMLASFKSNASGRKMRLFACACCRRIWHLLIDDRSRIAVEKSELYADHLININELGLAWAAAKDAQSALATRHQEQLRALGQVIRSIWDLGSREQTLGQGAVDEMPVDVMLDQGSLFAGLGPEERTAWLREYEKNIELALGGQLLLSQLQALQEKLESKEDSALMNTVEAYRNAGSWSLAAAAVSRLAWVAETEEQAFYQTKKVAEFARNAMLLFPLPAAEKNERGSQCSLLREIVGNPFRPSVIDHSWVEWNKGVVFQAAQALYEKRDFDEMPRFGDLLQKAGCDSEDILNHCRSKEQHVRGCWVLDLILGKQ